MKYKWDCLREKPEKTELSDLALDVMMRELCTLDEYDEIMNDEHMYDMKNRMIFNKKFNLSIKKVTVYFHKEGSQYEDEAILEMMRIEYNDEKCQKGAAQKSKLSEAEMRGLKSLKKRVSDSKTVIVPTDKSGRLAVMSLAMYEVAGQEHTKKDEEIPLSKVRSTQTVLNGHSSMLMKVFRIGAEWGHTERFRETIINNSLAVCHLDLLYKDNKEWDVSCKWP